MTAPGGTASARVRREQVEAIAREAGELVRSRWGTPGTISSKSGPGDERAYDVVTEVDYLSEQLVLGRIHEVSPDALVLAEEGGVTTTAGERSTDSPHDAQELWLIDPIDGTINFAHGIPHFCVSIACWRAGRPVAGVVYDPVLRECFSFERELGDEGGYGRAFHDGVPVHLGDGPEPEAAVLYLGGGGPRVVPIMRRFRSWRRMGSAALALAWTGIGRTGGYVQLGSLHPWDWAAGVPFIQAAGGVVTDAGCAGWIPRLDAPTGIVAAGRTIHRKITPLVVEAVLVGGDDEPLHDIGSAAPGS